MAEGLQSNEKQLEEETWSELFPHILRKVYSFLNRRDRANISRVCKNWNKAFQEPDVWEKFHFDFTCEQLNKHSDAIMEFVEKHCLFFTHVQITWNIHVSKNVILTWLGYFQQFYTLLSSASKLDSIKFNFERYNIRRIDDPTRKKVCKEIGDFMKSKCNLKRLEIYNCSFFYKDGVDLLKIIIKNNEDSLKHLVLRGFVTAVSPGNVDDSTNQFHLPSLETLKIDYLVVLGIGSSDVNDFNQKLRHCRKEMAITIFIVFENPVGTMNFKNLASDHWGYLKREYPNLEIEMKFGYQCEIFSNSNYFVESMPITRLDYNFDFQSSNTEWEINRVFFLDLIKKRINHVLVELSLVWQIPIRDFSSLFQFVSACSELRRLQVTTLHPVTKLRYFLRSLLKKRPESLKKFVLNIAGTGSENNEAMLRNLADEFAPRLKLLNITFDLHFLQNKPLYLDFKCFN